MLRKFGFLAVSALIAGLLAVPAGASATELRGVVSGSPYGASQGYIAVPVLYSKMSARRAGLKSPVGLMVVKRTAALKVNGAPSTPPVGLRVGDRWKGEAQVSALAKRVFYPRITFDSAQVYFRSRELSLSELTNMIQALQVNLALLNNHVGALTGYTIKGFTDLAAQIAALQKQIDELKGLLGALPASVDLSGLQGQINDLRNQLAGVIGSLADYARLSDLPDLSAYLTAADLPDLSAFLTAADLPDLTGFLTAADLPDLTGFLTAADLPDLSAFLTAADLPDVQGMIDATVTGLNLGQYALGTELDAAEAEIATLNTRLNDLCTSLAGATVDPDGAGGPMPAVPVTLPGIATACP